MDSKKGIVLIHQVEWQPLADRSTETLVELVYDSRAWKLIGIWGYEMIQDPTVASPVGGEEIEMVFAPVAETEEWVTLRQVYAPDLPGNIWDVNRTSPGYCPSDTEGKYLDEAIQHGWPVREKTVEIPTVPSPDTSRDGWMKIDFRTPSTPK